jgi:hypothetical protein
MPFALSCFLVVFDVENTYRNVSLVEEPHRLLAVGSPRVTSIESTT